MSTDAYFDVWGCRGSRSSAPGRSRIGSYTSCYSLHRGEDLFVFDAGRGLASLADATFEDPRLAQVTRIHVLISHAHLDHWEGLKDASWFWTPKNGRAVTIYGTSEALATIVLGLAPPAFVPLEVLALGTVETLAWVTVKAGDKVEIGRDSFEALHLNHYSGLKGSRRDLDTVGFRVALRDGPSVSYLSDHEPVPETQGMEDAAAHGSALMVMDCQFADVIDHAFGHGSQEHAAGCARRHPRTLILAAHHGPRTDDQIEEARERHGAGLENFALAIEGQGLLWDVGLDRFVACGRAGVSRP